MTNTNTTQQFTSSFTNTKLIINIYQAQYDKGHTPEWVKVPISTAQLAREHGITIDEVVYHFDGRTLQDGRESIRRHNENIERARESDRWTAKAATERGEYRLYLLDKASGF